MIFKIVYWSDIIFLWTALHKVPPIPRVNWGKMVTHSILIIMGTTTVKLIGDDGTVVREIARTINVISLQTVMPLRQANTCLWNGHCTIKGKAVSGIAAGWLHFTDRLLFPFIWPLTLGSTSHYFLRIWHIFGIEDLRNILNNSLFFFSPCSQHRTELNTEYGRAGSGMRGSFYHFMARAPALVSTFLAGVGGWLVAAMHSAPGWEIYTPLDPWQKLGVCSLHLMGQAVGRTSREARKT